MTLTAPAIRGYAQPEDVAAFLGLTFTPAQQLACAAVIARAEDWVDQETNRTWLSGPVLDETFFSPYGLDPPSFFTNYVSGWVPLGSALYLARTPVQSVEAIKGTGWLGSDEVTLVRNLDYEVRDLTNGLIRVTVPSAYYRIRANYTPVDACPPKVTQATVMIAATWMIPNLNPDAWQVESVALPDLKVTYAKGSNTLGVPPEVAGLLEPLRFRSTA